MLKVVNIERENKKEQDTYYSKVAYIHVRCLECKKAATVVTLPPQGKDLTIACRDCKDGVVIDAIQLADIEMPFEACSYDNYCYDWLVGC